MPIAARFTQIVRMRIPTDKGNTNAKTLVYRKYPCRIHSVTLERLLFLVASTLVALDQPTRLEVVGARPTSLAGFKMRSIRLVW